ncbi:MAG TPA: hypothetical protein VJV03_02690 [Pyrinomonadaceae bacterium]|nr:hypothetical protein [Pyrinomonadaceae bacterium]
MPHAPSNANTSAWFGRDLPLSWTILASILLVYLLFPTKNYYWDGVFFARVIEAAPGFNSSLFHPNHLLYNAAGYFLYKMTRAVGLSWRAIEVLQIANSIVSVFTSYVLYLILRRRLRSNYLVWSLTLIFAFSSTWWKFSTDADAYIFSVFFLLSAFYFTLPDFRPRPLLVALIFSFATLFHQLAVIAYPVIALSLYWQSAAMPARERKLIVAQFCILSFAIVFITYCSAFYLLTGSTQPPAFARWVTSYSPDASFSFDPLSNLGYTLRGHLRLFFNARLSLLRGLLNPVIIATIVVFGTVVLLWLLSIIKGTEWRRPDARNTFLKLKNDKLAHVSLVWVGLYLVFLFFWLPHNTFYRLFYLPALILLLATLLKENKRDHPRPTWRLGLFVPVIALFNFLFFIYPYSHVEKNPPLSLAVEMNRVWQPGTILYFHSENSDNNLVAYFNPKLEWRPLRSFDQLDDELKQLYTDGRTAWLEASAIDQLSSSPAGMKWLAQHGRQETWHERKARGYNVKFIQVGP